MNSIIIQSALVITSIIVLTILYFLTEYTVSTYGMNEGQTPYSSSNNKNTDNPLQRVTDIPSIPSRAIILCSVVPPVSDTSFKAAGYNDCRTMYQFFQGNTSCPSGCLGFASCAAVCPSDAIQFSENHIFVTDACIGCGLCIPLCPKNLIKLIPLQEAARQHCAAASSHTEYEHCPLKNDDYFLDFRKFPQSGFKKLQNWGIITEKTRY